MADTNLADIAHTIQIAVAPVFLLTAIGSTLSVLVARLGRIIDRARALEADGDGLGDAARGRAIAELALLQRRANLIHLALSTGVGAALMVCLLISLVFIGYLTESNVGQIVALLFIVAMGLFVVCLVTFLREVFVALRALKFGLVAARDR